MDSARLNLEQAIQVDHIYSYPIEEADRSRDIPRQHPSAVVTLEQLTK